MIFVSWTPLDLGGIIACVKAGKKEVGAVVRAFVKAWNYVIFAVLCLEGSGGRALAEILSCTHRRTPNGVTAVCS